MWRRKMGKGAVVLLIQATLLEPSLGLLMKRDQQVIVELTSDQDHNMGTTVSESTV
jgi:hypothetical protein